MELILTTPDELEAVISRAVSKAINKQSPQLPSDRCNKEEAIQFLNEQGYKISESRFYKLTAANELPAKRFGSRLVFSRKELISWIESQLLDNSNKQDTLLSLAKSARAKQKNR
ncbi:helix-turn-helix domain-containing protein [Adhaeribacter radiodurans]|uniref:Helix-turn-helix domain-containing protein n=1 Tax=Adhaeribacter radiodurans TaxID=2745197 RepID=A0A7L7LBD2_9BACT|nr:helix-turn-helix domain-containing protein [Adhaeribacter radiodurans]QMU30130.1 helix-turn-helix domain-containing protein [Adhaeribacter radiodurans]